MKIYKKIVSLLTIGVLSATMTVGCGKREDSTKVLNVYNVGDYIDEELITKFEEETGIKVLYETYDTNEMMYQKVQSGSTNYDLVFPSDYMVEKMRKEDLLQKIDFKNWINTDHKLTLKVLNFVSSRMYEQSLKTGEVLAYPAICILTNYLINVFESQDKDVVFLEKTREEIGSILGFSVRTINRNLKELKDENLITVNRKGISITKEQFDKLLNKLESIK
ncbi:MAG: helix-turn-helix domain-containing protein [Romboutsia sp.]|uniref:helix-turn-helix domain-containing protein n=1 Tax=Romboutsia sp. TaxID=1965302 RepID=UPI00217499E3|nr:helix-turn-helix domain-containing protein [Romboutsia sp.]